MPQRTTPPFRADHVGSLLRPPEVLRAREDAAAGRITAEELRAVEDRAIADVVRMQEDVGLQSATDGEFRRGVVAHGLHLPARRRPPGRREAQGRSSATSRASCRSRTPALVVDERITLPGADLRRRLRGSWPRWSPTATPKLTIPSPSMVHYRGGRPRSTRRSTPTWTSSGTT